MEFISDQKSLLMLVDGGRRRMMSPNFSKKTPTRLCTSSYSKSVVIPRSGFFGSVGLFLSVRIDLPLQVLQNVATHAKSLNKPIYVFSIDTEENKVVHVNYLPQSMVSKAFDARVWANKVSAVLGGKVRLSILLEFPSLTY